MIPATEPAPEVASCSLRNSRWTSRGSSFLITASRERRMEVSPGAKKHFVACLDHSIRIVIERSRPAKHRSIDCAWANTVHADVVFRIIERHGTHESQRSVLAYHVG